MSQRPDWVPLWATANPAGISRPSDAQTQTGWISGEPAYADVMNALQNKTGDWITYLDSQSNAVSLASTLEPSIRLLSGGPLSWSLTSTTLTWAAPLMLAYPGVSDVANNIPAGSAVIPSGSVLWVQANAPFVTIATATSGSAQLTDVAYADQIGVGWLVSGPGIPDGTTVQSLGSDGTSVQMTNTATATSAGQSFGFSASGNLTIHVTPMASLVPAPNMVVLARATESRIIVGVGTGQMVLRDGESKHLLESGYSDVRRLVAGAALTAGQFVYLSNGSADSRTAGQAYPADATAALRAAPLGVNVTAHATGDTAQIVTDGVVAGFSGLSAGVLYYLDPANPGKITSAKPSTNGQYIVPVGLALTATTLRLLPGSFIQAQAVLQNLNVTGNLTVQGTSTLTGSVAASSNLNVAGQLNAANIISGNSIQGASLSVASATATGQAKASTIVATTSVTSPSFISAQGFRQSVFMGTYLNSNGQPTGDSTNRYAYVAAYDAAASNNIGAQVIRRHWNAAQAGSVLSLGVTSDVSFQGVVIIVYKNGNYLCRTQELQSFTNPCCGASNNFGKGQYTFDAFDTLYVTASFNQAGNYRLSFEMGVEMAA